MCSLEYVKNDPHDILKHLVYETGENPSDFKVKDDMHNINRWHYWSQLLSPLQPSPELHVSKSMKLL